MTRSLTIAGQTISDDSRGHVIAEVASNHSGSLEQCKRLFDAAKSAGADSVKLQKRSLPDTYTAAFLAKEYNSENAFAPTYGEHRALLEFDAGQHHELLQYAHSLSLAYGCTAFDVPSLWTLVDLGVDYIKVASGDLTNTPFLKEVGECCARAGIPAIVSTGTGGTKDVVLAYMTLERTGAQFALLQCQAIYPPSAEQLNLRVIETFRTMFPKTVIGLSSHYSGVIDGPLAYLLGGRIFEKHFTLDRAAKGTDHAFSLSPAGLAKLRNYIDLTRVIMGDGIKRRLDAEEGAIEKMGKALRAARDLPAGHVLTEADFAIKSPGGYPEPYKMEKYLGRVLPVPLAADEPLCSTGDVLERVIV